MLRTTAADNAAPTAASKTANPSSAFPNDARLLTQREVLALVPFCRQSLMRLEAKGLFPKRIKLGRSRIVWLEHELLAWLAERAAARDAA